MSLSSAALAATVIAVGWIGMRALPLMAAPQESATDAPGVQVDTGGFKLLHRMGVDYPREANGVTGTVTADLTLNNKGEVTDARVTSGPEELRAAVLASVLHWHFATDTGAPSTVQVTVRFTNPPPPGSQSVMPKVILNTLGENKSATLTRIDASLPEALRDQVAQALPVHIGQEVTIADLENTIAALRGVDEHLQVAFFPAGEGKVAMKISIPGEAAAAPERIRVGSAVAHANLIEQPVPVYPPAAKAARLQGTVRFTIVVGKDGHVKNIELVSGHPLLAQAAKDAVGKWVYRPTLLNGNPIEVVTTVDVNFTLSQ